MSDDWKQELDRKIRAAADDWVRQVSRAGLAGPQLYLYFTEGTDEEMGDLKIAANAEKPWLLAGSLPRMTTANSVSQKIRDIVWQLPILQTPNGRNR